MGSFRAALAFRVALLGLGVSAIVLLGATLYLRAQLLSNTDALLIELAELSTTRGTLPGSGAILYAPPSARLGPGKPARRSWAQLVGGDGAPGARSGNLHEAIPVPAGALEAARGGRPGFATHRWKTETVRSVVYPIGAGGPALPARLLQVTTSLEPLQVRLGVFAGLLAGLGLLATALGWGIGWLTAGRALTPALELTAQAEAFGANQLGRRVRLPADPAEFRRLAVAFNALLDRLERAVTGTRRFTSDASHELRAPLTVLRGELELALSRARSPAEYQEVLRCCLDEVLRLVRLADDLLTLTRVQGGVIGGKRDPVELDEVVERVVRKKTPLAEARGVSLDLMGAAGLVAGDSELLFRAVEGLVEHAIMASPRDGRVRVRLAADLRRSVEVTDGGPGLKSEEVSGVFQRFYRSSRLRLSSGESGLEIPIARAVALSHGGALEYVGNDPGASFCMSLPAAG